MNRSFRDIAVIAFLLVTIGGLPCVYQGEVHAQADGILDLVEKAEEKRFAQPDSALNWSRKAMDLMEEGEEVPDSLYLRSHLVFGTAYYVRSDYHKSLFHYRQARDLAKEIEDRARLGIALNGIGLNYMGTGKYKDALKAYAAADDIARQIDDSALLSTVALNSGIIYEEQGRPDTALKCFSTALKLGAGVLRDGRMGLTELWYAKSLKSSGFLDSAMRIVDRALARPKLGEWHRGFGLVTRGEVLFRKGQFENALNDLDKALVYLQKVQAPWDIQQVYKVRSEVYEEMGNYEQAFDNLNQYHELYDSLFRVEKERELNYQLLQDQERINQLLEERNHAQKKAINRNQWLVFYSILGLVCLSIVVIVLLRSRKQKLAMNRRLEAMYHALSDKNMELTQSNAEKDLLLGIVGHDLRQPIHHILSISDLADSGGGFSRAELHKYLEEIQRSALRANLITEKILKSRNLDDIDAYIDLKPIELAPEVKKAVRTFEKSAVDKGIAIEMGSLPDGKIWADESAFLQVMGNLLSNAIKFSPSGSTVEVGVEKEGQNVHIQVSDEGPGISKEDGEKIFSPYVSLSAKPTGGEESHGLGLAISKKLMESMDGDIEFSSRPQGGTTFSLVFKKVMVQAEGL